MNDLRLQIRYRAFNSGGKGGQNCNRSMNAIEASVQLPCGEVLSATSQLKSQARNKKIAAALLVAKVQQHFSKDNERHNAPTERVRTYNIAENRVTDHASGVKMTWDKASSTDGFAEIIAARISALTGVL